MERIKNKNTLSLSSALLCVIIASLVSFLAGRAARGYILQKISFRDPSDDAKTTTSPLPYIHDLGPQHDRQILGSLDDAAVSSKKKPMNAMTMIMHNSHLPPPRLIDGKKVPKTKYTSMIFREVHVASEKYSSLHLTEMSAGGDDDEGEKYASEREVEFQEVCVQAHDGNTQCSVNKFDTLEQQEEVHIASSVVTLNSTGNEVDSESEDDEEEDDEEHLPAGQHLLVDIERVNGDFLNSEERLAEAMVQVVNESKLTLLSYHCHKLIPMGVSCVGVLLESHISFHTWPESGVITLDLFTCGEGELIPVLPVIKRLFAVPMEGVSDDADVIRKPRIVWTHKLRGFRDVGNHLSSDLGEMVLEASSFELKEEIVSVKTPLQRIDIYDTIHKGDQDIRAYEESLMTSGSYESLHPQLFQPNRLVFLDGVLQSMRDGNEAYHEALVHPGMFYHPEPRRVAIIGGGEGSTLREVLKHNTVENVTMIEIDEMMVKVSREYLPDWNDCSDLQGSAKWCGDDERAEIKYLDAFRWFNDRFSSQSKTIQEEPFDVLIMDALDPEDDIPFAAALYNDYDFVETLYNSLTEAGVLVLQLGEAPYHDSPASQFTKGSRRESLINILVEVGFETLHLYEDGNCGFDGSWTYLVAAKDASHDMRWYMRPAEVEVEIHRRTVRTVSGAPTLKYFDGGVMQVYQFPHKVFELVFCRMEPKPDSCISDVTRENVPLSDFEVRMSGVGDGSGRGVYTKVDIKQGSSIARKENAHPVHIPASSLSLIYEYMDDSTDLRNAYGYIDGYGWETETFGGEEYYVESNIMTFMNHGCDGSFNVLDWTTYESWIHNDENAIVTEQNATIDLYQPFRDEVYDIFTDRHIGHSALTYTVASRDIKAGEELLSSYMFYSSDEELWLAEVEDLKRVCLGEDVGFITKAEKRLATGSEL